MRDNEQYLLAGGLAFYSRDRGAGGSVLSRSIARDKYQGNVDPVFALLMTVNGTAPVLSPVLGGYIVSTFDWRTLFWVMAEISTVLLLGCLLFINETLPENKRAHHCY